MHLCKTIRIAIIVFCCSSVTSFSQTFQRCYGGTAADEGYAAAQTADGGFMVAGFTSSTCETCGIDAYLVKTASDAGIIWSRTYGGTGTDKVFSAVQTSDGGYILAGSTNSFGAGGYDVYLVKTNSAGIVDWSQSFGGTGDEEANSIVQTTDGGYALTGYSNSYSGGTKDVYLIKTNSDLSASWSKTYGSTDYDDEAYSIIETSDGGYAVTGYTQDYVSAGTKNVYIVRTDAGGTVSWTRVVGGGSTEIAYDIVENTDGGFLVVGASNGLTFGQGGYEMYFVKTNSDGGLVWDYGLGWDQDDEARSVILLSSGSYIITGYTKSAGAGGKDAFMLRYSNDGTTVSWAKTIGGATHDEGRCLALASDGSYLMCGSSASSGAGSNGMYFVKASSAGGSCTTSDWFAIGLCNGLLGNGTGFSESSGGSLTSGGTSSSASSVPAYNACTNSPLPVELLDFYGTHENEVVTLKWTTATELNNNYFEIQRKSVDAEEWTVIGYKQGAGSSSTANNYEFKDIELPSPEGEGLGVRFYRLKQTDYNGDFSYSNTVAVKLSAEEFSINVLTNPTDRYNMRLNLNAREGKEVLVVLYNTIGEEIYSKIIIAEQNGNNAIALSPSHRVTSGMYFITASSDNKLCNQKLVVR